MTARSPYRVDPDFEDKYYVYMLLRPDNTIFYIGKGQGMRINNHFSHQRVYNGSIKSNIIKKYGIGNIKRQIISYHDNEDEAYNLEEYLIAYYGVMAEGGTLSNVSKTRYDYPDNVKDYIAKNLPTLPKKYTEHQILEVYNLYYKEDKTTRYISNKLNICASYLSYIVRGAKCKDIFEREGIQALREAKLVRDKGKARTIPSIQKYEDKDIVRLLDLYYKDNLHIKEIIEITGVTHNYIRSLISGNKRVDVVKEYHKENSAVKRCKVRDSLKGEVKTRLLNGEKFSTLEKEGKYSKTSLRRWAIQVGVTFTEPKSYTEDQILQIYNLHFIDKTDYNNIFGITGVPINYIKALVKGRKRKKLLFKYISENGITL